MPAPQWFLEMSIGGVGRVYQCYGWVAKLIG